MPLNDDFDGPIPGENYTSDTKNYPWHRAPQFDNLDKAITYIGKKLTSKDASYVALTLLEAGLTVVDVTEIYLMQGVSTGKWTMDFALMLAGPTAHILVLMADGYGVKYNLGTEDDIVMYPADFFKAKNMIDKSKAAKAGASVDIGAIQEEAAAQPQATGLMGAPAPSAPNEQQAMLGQVEQPVEGMQ